MTGERLATFSELHDLLDIPYCIYMMAAIYIALKALKRD